MGVVEGGVTSIDKEVSPKLDSGRDVMAFSPQVLEYGESQFLLLGLRVGPRNMGLLFVWL
jgi:hypothetical protein